MKQEQGESNYKVQADQDYGMFEAIFEHTSAPSKIIDSDLKILRVNAALVELLGYSAAEMVGTEMMDYACKQVKHHWKDLQMAMWEHGQPKFTLDACLRRKDGRIAWVHITTVRFQQDGESYAYTVLDDYTAQKALEDTQQRLSMALDNSRMAVWELNLSSGQLIHTSGFRQLFGIQDLQANWRMDQLLSQFIAEDEHQLREVFAAAVAESVIDFQGRVRTQDGVLRWVYLQGRVSPTREGQPIKIVGTITDITKEKLAERDKDDFISIASHELRTPITAMKASLQLLEQMKPSESPKAAALITQANRSMRKITMLIDDLLNVNNYKEGQLRLKKTRFRIGSVVEDCCVHVTAEGVFDIITTGDMDTEIEADSERIQQVVINLVNNAMKYAHGSREIRIGIERLDGFVKVSVADQGPGIEKEKLPYLFERFYRADITSGQYSGLGLGLYISSEIIKRHQGSIGVDSELGKGSTFWFTLPCRA